MHVMYGMGRRPHGPQVDAGVLKRIGAHDARDGAARVRQVWPGVIPTPPPWVRQIWSEEAFALWDSAWAAIYDPGTEVPA